MSTFLRQIYMQIRRRTFLERSRSEFFLSSTRAVYYILELKKVLPAFWEPAETDSHNGGFWPKVRSPDVR